MKVFFARGCVLALAASLSACASIGGGNGATCGWLATGAGGTTAGAVATGGTIGGRGATIFGFGATRRGSRRGSRRGRHR